MKHLNFWTLDCIFILFSQVFQLKSSLKPAICSSKKKQAVSPHGNRPSLCSRSPIPQICWWRRRSNLTRVTQHFHPTVDQWPTNKMEAYIHSLAPFFQTKKRICNKFRCTVFLYIILRVGCTWGVQYFGIPCLSLAHRNRTGDMPPTAPSMPASTAAAHHSMAEVLHYLSWVGSPVIPLLLLGVRYHISHLQDFFDKSTVSQSFLKEEKFTTTVRI